MLIVVTGIPPQAPIRLRPAQEGFERERFLIGQCRAGHARETPSREEPRKRFVLELRVRRQQIGTEAASCAAPTRAVTGAARDTPAGKSALSGEQPLSHLDFVLRRGVGAAIALPGARVGATGGEKVEQRRQLGWRETQLRHDELVFLDSAVAAGSPDRMSRSGDEIHAVSHAPAVAIGRAFEVGSDEIPFAVRVTAAAPRREQGGRVRRRTRGWSRSAQKHEAHQRGCEDCPQRHANMTTVIVRHRRSTRS